MRSDALLAFVPIGSPLSIVLNAGQNVASQIIDLLGEGAGLAPTNIIGDQNATFGAPDAMGVGGLRPELNVTIGTAGVGATSTLNVALQAAADLGSPTYQPSTWNTLAETGAIAVANLTANTVVARFPWLPPFPANLRPRYLRLLFSVATANLTAGTIASAIVTTVRDDQFNKFAQKNFAVA
jgi:hypothetical protein